MESPNLKFNKDFIKNKIYDCEASSRTKLNDNFFTRAAILFSIVPYEDKPYDLILIHRTNRGLRHRGEISFPGGKLEKKDRSLRDTALRETCEEIGVSKGNIEVIGCLNDFPTMTKYIIRPFVGLIDERSELIREKREVQKILKVPIDFFTSKTNFREKAFNINDDKFPVFYFNYKEKSNNKIYTIWGATAHMIVSFIELVYDFKMSELGIKRFDLEKIKALKNYIKYKDKITRNIRE
ncbi:MAG: putative Nudix hydrolase NudL [Promethearchaeota archaeon]|nr:MAG: putative Nudix hydrolase NudL [Candidatus Lokiarchaeota archaeon]